uniref:Uncharacterized protein n=1 Tax=Romanomermis culicivorax TaxID=13658 RepID=A0A915KAM1_ROMCU
MNAVMILNITAVGIVKNLASIVVEEFIVAGGFQNLESHVTEHRLSGRGRRVDAYVIAARRFYGGLQRNFRQFSTYAAAEKILASET